jgi:hypothetical protein
MWLTGAADGAPLVPDGPVLARAELAADGLRDATSVWGVPVSEPVAPLLFGRAAWLGFGRQGRVSANGSCRLIRASDGWVAVNLARPEDIESVPAIINGDESGEPWTRLQRWATSVTAREAADRSQLLGVPAAPLPPRGPKDWGGTGVTILQLAEPEPRVGPPTVIDLSSLWAGPLCAHLLGKAGARVTKVESASRPDGARRGNQAFWSSLHQGQAELTLDLRTGPGREELLSLVRSADVVVEGSRPRALRQLGIVAEDIVAEGRGVTWVSITGYGRDAEGGDLVAFGDDAAVAGGLVAWDSDGAPVFCGDAIADPLSGLVAAAAAAEYIAAGGGRIVEVSMAGVAGWAAAPGPAVDRYEVRPRTNGGWTVQVGDDEQDVLPPRPPERIW